MPICSPLLRFSLVASLCFCTFAALAQDQKPTTPYPGPQNPGPGTPVPQSIPPAFPGVDPTQNHLVPPKGPIRIGEGVIAGQLLKHVQPVYPEEAKAQGIDGIVILHAIIGKDGTIKNLTPVTGPDILVESAIKAVSQWTYRPYMLNGFPTEVDTRITVSFNLNHEPTKKT